MNLFRSEFGSAGHKQKKWKLMNIRSVQLTSRRNLAFRITIALEKGKISTSSNNNSTGSVRKLHGSVDFMDCYWWLRLILPFAELRFVSFDSTVFDTQQKLFRSHHASFINCPPRLHSLNKHDDYRYSGPY